MTDILRAFRGTALLRLSLALRWDLISTSYDDFQGFLQLPIAVVCSEAVDDLLRLFDL